MTYNVFGGTLSLTQSIRCTTASLVITVGECHKMLSVCCTVEDGWVKLVNKLSVSYFASLL